MRDFNGLPRGIPASPTAASRTSEPSDRVGCIRHFHTRDGGTIRERLLALSDYDYACTYSILESPMGVDNYVATLKLTPVTDGARTFAEWSAEFDCAEGRERELSRAHRPGRVPGRLRCAEAPLRIAPLSDSTEPSRCCRRSSAPP